VLGQLSHRVQHALRAFTPRDQKAVKAAAQTMRPQPGLDVEAAITELAVGEALVSFLDAKGRPTPTERAFVVPPGSQIGPINAPQRTQLLQTSLVAGVYEKVVDRESAYEMLRASGAGSGAPAAGTPGAPADTTGKGSGLLGGLSDVLFGSTGPRGGRHDGLAQTMAKSAIRSIGSAVGREIIRGVLGSVMGGRKRR
jgi:DNA helicase HerA-like ATPase